MSYLIDNILFPQVEIPDVLDDSISVYEKLNKMRKSLNALYDQYKKHGEITKELTGKYTDLVRDIEKILNKFDEFTKGNTIPDSSITLNKLSYDTFKQLERWVKKDVSNIAKFIVFGLDDNGVVYCDIPDSWNVSFEMENGVLIMNC